MKKIVVLAVVLGVGLWWFREPAVTAPGTGISFGYIVEYSGDAGRGDHLPLLVALHGNGDTPENFYLTALDGLSTPARVVLVHAPLERGMGGRAWPMGGEELPSYGDALADVIELLAERFPTTGKPAVFGFSGGGVMAYFLAGAYPDRYSSVVPVSGLLPPASVGGKAAVKRGGAEVFAFHGTQDQVIAVGGGRNAVGLLKKGGLRVEFKEFNGGHLGVFSTVKEEITALLNTKLSGLAL